jgi:tetratricopeptide (TPR) repeat protein
MLEVAIHIDVDAAGTYQFRMRSGGRDIATSVSPALAASFYEDLRLLRWKSTGVLDPGDTLLNHVGYRLAALIAPRETWDELRLPDDALHVRVQFAQGAHRLMPFPWELLRVNGHFLLGRRGNHLVREVPAPGRSRRRRNPVLSVVHVSLGTDSALRFDEERCSQLETLPPGIPIEFLIDPSPGHLATVMDGFRPHIVIISGHGHYDDLRGEHYLSTDNTHVPTARLVELCTSYGCQLLVLSTCESARLGGPVIDDGTALPADLIAFSFPVRTTTAIQSLTRLLAELVRGQSVDDAMAAVRAIDTEDEYAFFNSVHLHRWRARSLRIEDEAPPAPVAPATRCPGMEMVLGTLNSFAHWLEPATLLAAVGGGGEAVVRHWAELVQRSQTQATRWRVVTDNGIVLDNDGAQLVRLAHPYSFTPIPTEHIVYCDGMDRRRAKTLLAAHDPDVAKNVAAHPLLGIRAFIDDLIAGRTVDDAVERFERENHMAERATRLNREGILYASWLFATDSTAATTFEDRAAFGETAHDFGMPAPVIVAGLENAVAARVILDLGDHLILAPEFMLLGDRWFPNWREDHRAGFRIICGALAVLAARGTIDVEKGARILDWAIRLEDWPMAVMICVSMCRWYGEHGRLEDMKPTIERVLPHATGMLRFVLRGHLVTIATNNGDYRTGLAENQQLEIDLQDLPRNDDYYLNLQATITQQIDCLRELGRLDEAEQRWRDAHDLLPRLTELREDAEARLLGQLAQLRNDRDDGEGALDAATQAVHHADTNHSPAMLVAQLRHTRADLLRQLGRDQEAMEELNAVATVEMAPALRSRFLHLKALLLEDRHGAQALEHLLQSYEVDRLRGDRAGVAVSLMAITRIFKEQHEYDRARERIREALPLADACGLANIVASLALLWAEIDLAEGKTTSAVTWLSTSNQKFTESQDQGGVKHVTRMLERLRPPGNGA